MPKQRITPKNKTVTFLLPFPGTVPIGGFKIVYEYANRLADRGWAVQVIHPRMLTRDEVEATRRSLFRRTRRWLGDQRHRITGDYRPDRWFKVRPNVKLLCTQTLDTRDMPPSDVWVATAWNTANWAANCAGAHLYLIQHLETWDGPEADVMATWKLPLRKVVISRWLEDVARSLGESAAYIPNGLDFERFGMDVAPGNRNPQSVAMLYHQSLEWKGSMDGFAALNIVKASVPTLTAHVFGVFPRPSVLPNWVDYHQNPPQNELREIYNKAAIFISPSWTEGWGLPSAEALQCGAALAVTDIGGHREFAHHGETALLSPPKDPSAMAANVLRLIEDQELRIRLARQGHHYVQQFTWDRAVTHFESVLEEALARGTVRRSESVVSQ
jgi:glycosyltransferase involved in cell wall biosynthesis